ncbi:hypothetical protein amb0483 [Paramagnetospirillum magneticum AMB-1]|uniref:Uncharacterized protein n=1 Tax=Paramagnetospirillum magneticum (strain ATCC 700264 / AMB-1) TaxID=342108 RepID=Q2WA38_PARM1|nr:hypothetical protein amb0483 [Paramagnetospirillum magneticum AMB-1]
MPTANPTVFRVNAIRPLPRSAPSIAQNDSMFGPFNHMTSAVLFLPEKVLH